MLERWRRGLHREAPAEQGRAAPPELLHRQAQQGLRAARGRGQEDDADAAAAALRPTPRRRRRVGVGAAGTFRRSRDGTYAATGARTCRRKSRWQNPF